MALPLVSVVINNFNYAKFLPQCVESALAQSYPHMEVVVVDDASTDGSRDVIRGFGDRIKPLLQERNGGQAAALNAGFTASRGALVLFLDADDFLYPTAAARVAAGWKPGVGVVQYRLHLVDGEGRTIDLYPPSEVRFDKGDVVEKLLTTGRYEGTVTSGIAFARSALLEVMPIPAEKFRIGADGYLVTTAPFYGTVAAIEEPLGAYRRHGTNQWMVAPSLALGFRRAILHDADKHRALAERARTLGLHATAHPGLHDYQHVGVRLGSLVMDPAQHPVKSDTRIGLAMRGTAAVRHASLPLKRRVVVATWCLCVGALPTAISRRLIAWRYETSSRPGGVDRLLKILRRTTR
jgi:hypothetical protein